MARIRSIHPGLFTDEAYMMASPHARLLLPGLWCESWDDGVLEWRPARLKARLMPYDSVDIEALLAELVDLDFLHPFEVEGKRYAAIRNFRKWQTPKTPNSSKVLPSSLRAYVGLAMPLPPNDDDFGSASEASKNHFGNTSEIAGQKGRREEGKKEGKEFPLSSLRSDNAPPLASHGPDGGDIEMPEGHPAGKVASQLPAEGGGPTEPGPELPGFSPPPVPASRPGPDPNDPRAVLFSWGLDVLMRATGRKEKPVRGWIGLMLKTLGDDATTLNAVILEAQRVRPAEPEAWMNAAVKSRSAPPKAKPNAFGDAPLTPEEQICLAVLQGGAQHGRSFSGTTIEGALA